MFALTPFNRRGSSIARRNDFFDLDNMFEDFFSDAFIPTFFRENPIKADIKETDKEYIVEAEIPGVKKEDIKLELRDDVLTIGVERNEQLKEERENYIRKERRYGSYCRSFRLDNIKNEGVTAKYNDGILTVNIPKAEDGKSKHTRIDIH